MKQNLVVEKSYAFALRVVGLYRFLSGERREYLLSKQVLRSGTSIGANIEEALGGQSRKEFYSRLSIAYREARETHYWLRLLRDGGYLDARLARSMLDDCEELLRIISAIRKTTLQRYAQNIPSTPSL